MVILQGLLNYVKQWDKELKDDLVYPDSRRLIVKYGTFLSYDKQKCKTQLLKLIKEDFLMTQEELIRERDFYKAKLEEVND